MVKVCKEHFSAGKAWDDPRTHLHIVDGCQFVKDAPDNFYDVVIQDSSDPWEFESGSRKPLPSAVLFTKEHFRQVHRILTPRGIFNYQVRTDIVCSSVFVTTCEFDSHWLRFSQTTILIYHSRSPSTFRRCWKGSIFGEGKRWKLGLRKQGMAP